MALLGWDSEAVLKVALTNSKKGKGGKGSLLSKAKISKRQVIPQNFPFLQSAFLKEVFHSRKFLKDLASMVLKTP